MRRGLRIDGILLHHHTTAGDAWLGARLFHNRKGDKAISLEENKQLVLKYHNEVVRRNLDVIDEVYAPQFIANGTPSTPQDIKYYFIMVRTGLPDFQGINEYQIAEGDRVVTRWTNIGTYLGELFGVPPTGKLVKITGISIHRIVNGKIVEQWVEANLFGLFKLLGRIE